MSPTTLYFKEGSSDKVYRVAIEQRPGGSVVTFAYGRRGTTLTTGTKTTSPVPVDEAQRIAEKLIREKQSKGYVLGAGTPAYTEGSRRVTSVRPQLLNPTDDVEALLDDNAFYLQPKHDGKRLLVLKRDGQVTASNRRGIECGIPEGIYKAALAMPGDFLLDGEAVGDILHAFDLLESDGVDLRGVPYKDRLGRLLQLLGRVPQSGVHWVTTLSGSRLKRELFVQLRREQAEGVVFKRIDAPYTPGRPNSGGDQLKFKFVETASVVIHGINVKRSVAMAVWENGTLVSAGNVTIPPDQPIPLIGDVAEIRYLYAMPGSGALFQPVYRGTRDDITAAECTRDQLKFRPEPKAAAA